MLPRAVTGGHLEYDPEHDDAIRASAQPSSHVATFDLAGWWVRVGAYLIDVVILIVGLLIVVSIAFAINRVLGVIVAILSVIVYLVGYWTYLEGSERGQTLGKRAVGIRVVADDGTRAGYGRAFGRNLVARVVQFLPVVGLLDVLWPLWDSRNQCLHDKAASTLVVRT